MRRKAHAPTKTRKRWREADFEQRRQLIIEAAMELLVRHGVEAVTMRRVAERLGVGAMTLYTYVDSQEQLRREMTRRGFEMLREGCQAADRKSVV